MERGISLCALSVEMDDGERSRWGILGGRYLDVDEKITVGTRLLINVFEVCVVSCMKGESIVKDQIEVVDLRAKPAPSKSRFGGCFWVLADEKDDEEEDD